MNYDTEAWYKLYIRESTEDRLLPVFNRALRDFLLRLAKSRRDATILGKTENPGEDIARALGAHPSETAMIAQYVATMLEDGYLTHRRGRLWITNFVSAQEARSPGAKRQKKYRDKAIVTTRDVTGDAGPSVTGDVTGDARETSQKIRSEKSREETRRAEETPRASATPPPPPAVRRISGSRLDDLKARIVDRERTAGQPPEPRHDPMGERFVVADWWPSAGILASARERGLTDSEFDAALVEARDKLTGLHEIGWFDVKVERFVQVAIERKRRPPGAVEHERRSGVRIARDGPPPDLRETGVSPETARLIGVEGLRRAGFGVRS